MKILVIGGSGHVGGLINPYLKAHHQVRVLDVKPPADPALEFVQGSLLDLDKVRAAMAGVEGLVYLAMGTTQGDDMQRAPSAYDVNVKGVHLALACAADAKVRGAVYASTLSVYDNWAKPKVQNEDTPPDASHLYGFTKRLGEEVCAWIARTRGLPVFALRLCSPVSDADWQKSYQAAYPGATSARDVAQAFHLALVTEHQGFTVLHITGDYENRMTDLSRAKTVLGWEPLTRPSAAPRASA